MNKVMILIFCIDLILFIYVFLFGLLYNILLFKNKNIIEKHFRENGYKLYVHDNENGKIVSRKERIKLIEALVKNNSQIKNQKLFLCMLKLYNSIFHSLAIIILITVALVSVLFFCKRVNDEFYDVEEISVSEKQNCDLFLQVLESDGYIQWDGIVNHDYNVAQIKNVKNCTPQNITDEISDLQIFCITDSLHYFMMYNKKIYRFDTFGGEHLKICLWDYDGNGKKDLVDFHSYGSGIPYCAVDIINLTKMEYIKVLHRNLLEEKEFSFDYKDESILIDGKELIYDGEHFHLVNKDKLLEQIL